MSGNGSPARLPPLPAVHTAPQGLGAWVAARLQAGWRGASDRLPLAPVWGMLMALCAFTALFLQGRVGTGQIAAILLLFFAGGMLAFPITVFLAQGLALGRRAETRFAGSFLCLTLSTIVVTAILFALQYRLFFARWHAPFATRIWFYQFAFTGAGAIYQFIVMGIRLYMPLGLPALLGMSLWLTRVQR
ncbi:hypothetical protein ASG39_04105 [Rhizobium sp. Leaf371]|uniref:hypothetical protein n=1 Tax=Rhizobium sp. Leaf371 TaxID=1736355 RepID=UPI0007143D44|nr:hypothetical protein [Rhizobium sp. Leaf371]KQS72919.1 hypothetical protein ASG39_04105 [Rhizobium sp. Leaf371]